MQSSLDSNLPTQERRSEQHFLSAEPQYPIVELVAIPSDEDLDATPIETIIEKYRRLITFYWPSFFEEYGISFEDAGTIIKEKCKLREVNHLEEWLSEKDHRILLGLSLADILEAIQQSCADPTNEALKDKLLQIRRSRVRAIKDILSKET